MTVEASELHCHVQETSLSFVAWLLEVAISRWVHRGHKGMDMVSDNTQVGWHLNHDQLVLRSPKCVMKLSPTALHHQQPEPLI